jgi:F420-non-reducing hydrogenase small subunit
MSKLNVAIYWGAACGGCDVAILDIHEKVLNVKEACNFWLWPVAMDFKYKDVEALADGFLDLTLFSGAVRNTENEHIAHLLRKKSKVLVAFGSCAHTGGIPALANFYRKEDILRRVYEECPSNDNPNKVRPQTVHRFPEGECEIPALYDWVKSLDQVVKVDYYVPGCPPVPERIWEVLSAVVSGAKLPPPGSVIGAGEKALCDTCERKRTDEKAIKEFKRIATTIPDPTVCFLDQGLICMGPVTRSGCGNQCTVASNMPCRGCYGQPEGTQDQGAKMVAAIGAALDAKEPEAIDKALDSLPDPAGYFYRFSMSSSLLERRKA